MKRTLIVALALGSLVMACKKKDAGSGATGSGSAAPTGSAGSAAAPAGSAAAPAGSAAAGSAAEAAGSAAAGSAAAGSAAPAPNVPEGKIVVKRNGADSMFDGDKAIYYKQGPVRAIVVTGDCDKLTCAM